MFRLFVADGFGCWLFVGCPGVADMFVGCAVDIDLGLDDLN